MPNDRSSTFSLGLEATCPDGLIIVSQRCTLRTQDQERLVSFGGMPAFGFAVGDEASAAYAMVLIEQSGFARQAEIADAFEVTTRTVQRNIKRYRKDGISALGQPRGWKKGRSRLANGLQARAARLKRKRLSNEEIARRLGVSAPSVAKLLKAEGLRPARAVEVAFPLGLKGVEGLVAEEAVTQERAEPVVGGEGSKTDPVQQAEPDAVSELEGLLVACGGAAVVVACEAVGAASDPPPETSVATVATVVESERPPAGKAAVSFDRDPSDRSVDRAMAALGRLEDAAPMFRNGQRVPGAGVLLAVPALVASGVLEAAREVYKSLSPAFYGLRTTFLTLLLMALLRIKRPEGLKERCPRDLGRVLGLDRAPEVKTLRRKLRLLCSKVLATELTRRIAKHRVEQEGEAFGFLYVDGHVRVYHGDKTIPKAHVTQMRISLPATTDYWVNDAAGDPVFVVTADANAGMVKMLPVLLKEMRPLLGDRRVTVVFDRGGYSPGLFRTLVEDSQVDILTYRKGSFPKVPAKSFQAHVWTKDGHEVAYELADQRVRIGKKKGERVTLRQVTRRKKNGHQTPILTSRVDLSTLEVAVRMFDRWRQENYFKYMKEEFALDGLVTYAGEPDDPKRDVPNPKRAALDKELAAARATLKKLQAEYGEKALENPERKRPTMRGFKIANGKVGRAVRAATMQVERLKTQRAETPERIAVGERSNGEPVVKLAAEMGRIQNLLKMVAYQAESDLVRLASPHYSRALQEGRTLVQAALASPADLIVDGKALTVVLAAQSSPHRSAAIQSLCKELNQTATVFPGSALLLRFAVAEPSGS